MIKKKYKAKKERIKQISEPAEAYSKKMHADSITISSINEQEESNYLYWLKLSPEERWAEHFKLLQMVFGKQKNTKGSVSRIIFDV